MQKPNIAHSTSKWNISLTVLVTCDAALVCLPKDLSTYRGKLYMIIWSMCMLAPMVVVVVPSTPREVWQGAVAWRRISPCLPAQLARTENKELTKLAMMSISIEGYVAHRCK